MRPKLRVRRLIAVAVITIAGIGLARLDAPWMSRLATPGSCSRCHQ